MDWKISKQPETEILKELQSNLNIPEFICTLLLQRNIDSLESAQKYFRPNLNELHDPFLMKDMDRTVDRLIQAIDSSEKIMILGDYDVDGTTSVSMLYDYFIKKTLEPIYYIPDRYKEGYGVSEESIAFAADQKVSLIITIDCGIKANDEIEAAQIMAALYGTHASSVVLHSADESTSASEPPPSITITLFFKYLSIDLRYGIIFFS